MYFLYPPPPSLFINAMSCMGVIAMANGGLSEMKGKHLRYSKFWNVSSKKSSRKQTTLSSKVGMLVAYTPALLVGLSSLTFLPDEGLRILLLRSALTIHFLKRVIEVLCIHKFSGRMVFGDAILISTSYATSTAMMIYSQHLSQGLQEPHIDLMYFGAALFFIGICGNFYHHYLLCLLRGKGEQSYLVPKGGLFEYVICPHYLFEILVFVGISMISQTLYSCSVALGAAFYLTGRSCATKRWYLSKFEDFPKNRKALIPYLL